MIRGYQMGTHIKIYIKLKMDKKFFNLTFKMLS